MAQLVKNPPPTQQIWVQSLGWEDPLVKETATPSSILAWRIPWTVCIVHGVAKSQTQSSGFHWLIPKEQFWNTGHQKLDYNHQLISLAAFPIEAIREIQLPSEDK